MCLIFVGQGYPQKLFNLEHFPIYDSITDAVQLVLLGEAYIVRHVMEVHTIAKP